MTSIAAPIQTAAPALTTTDKLSMPLTDIVKTADLEQKTRQPRSNNNGGYGKANTRGNNQGGQGSRPRRAPRATPYEQKQRTATTTNFTADATTTAAATSVASGLAAALYNPVLATNLVSTALATANTRKVVKVSSKSNVKSVAGAISHTTRSGECPTLMATGTESINQAIKAICVARQYLTENKLDLAIQPIFRNQEKGAVTFNLSKVQARSKKGDAPDDETSQLRVARQSEPNSTAGAIANKVRSGDRVIIQAIGASAVSVAVRSVALARRYLEADAIDLSFRPEFIHVKLDEGDRSAIKFSILASQI
jgi:stage V sporulation protein S